MRRSTQLDFLIRFCIATHALLSLQDLFRTSPLFCHSLSPSLLAALMARFDLDDMKKQASLYFRGKFKDVRLALTDVSRIQLLTEEATNADPWGPETKTLKMLSDAAYELEEYDRIVPVLRSRLEMREKLSWRQVYKTLVVLEYLLTHGPKSLLDDFKSVMDCIEELCQYACVDRQGVDRGLNIRRKADQIGELLCKTDVWKEERSRAVKISHGIKGFGSDSVKENASVPFESLKHEITSKDSVKDAGSQSSVSSVDAMVKEETNAASDVAKDSAVFHLYEKCVSSPLQFRETNSCSPIEFNPRISGEDKDELLAWSPFKKTLSSPGFRDNSASWQPFGDEILRETNDAGAHAIASSYDEDSQLLQVSEGCVQSSGKDETITVDLDDEKQRVRTSYRKSVRHLFGLHKSLKGSIENSPEKPAPPPPKFVAGSVESLGSQIRKPPSIKSDGFGVCESTASELANKSLQGQEKNWFQGPVVLSLPPPPRPGFRSKFQRHLHSQSLIDL